MKTDPSATGELEPHDVRSSAAALERALGDPARPGPLSHASAVTADEAEAFPSAACDALLGLGYLDHFVLARDGGRTSNLVDLVLVGRAVARRDLTVAIATGQTFLGALPVWLDGDVAQRAALAPRVKRGVAGCLALTEEAHGADLAATEVTVERDAGGLTLSGEKWCINNATRGGTLTLLARDGEAQSVVLVLKDPGSPEVNLPRIRTHGIRGADISGIRFARKALGEGAIVGRPGRGLDLVLRTLQVSRTVCAAFSLGAADTAIRLAHAFATGRTLYGEPAYRIPVVRSALAGALADLLAADALALVACRAASLVPSEMSVHSASVKVHVPALGREILREAAVVLGARGYLREGPCAIFQKMMRDHAVVELFDGSTPVNLSGLASQLARAAEARRGGAVVAGDLLGAGGLFDLGGPLPAFEGRGLRASARGADSLLGAVPALARRARDGGSTALAALAGELADEVATFDARVLENASRSDFSPSDAPSFALARRYCVLAAGAAVLGVALAPRGEVALPPTLADALPAVLGRVLGHPTEEPSAGREQALTALLDAWCAEATSFSWLPHALGT